MKEAATLADGRVIPATGRSYDMSGCAFLWLREGQIRAVHSYYDRVLMREQIGLPGGPVAPTKGR